MWLDSLLRSVSLEFFNQGDKGYGLLYWGRLVPGTILAKPIENRQVLTCFGKGKRNDTQLSIFAATLFFSCYGASLINWVRRENIFLHFCLNLQILTLMFVLFLLLWHAVVLHQKEAVLLLIIIWTFYYFRPTLRSINLPVLWLKIFWIPSWIFFQSWKSNVLRAKQVGDLLS